MIKSQEDEFIAVRVQDPRVQNEGSWSSYVDFKIFLHTNSKAFTAKTSCVRRRYSEFVWLKRKLQKNAGLVPVPDLPKKSLFSFINDDFIETRRKGLQSFLDKVLHMTVCLSDSQLHLFLQTQLPVRHIEDCVQGHTPYTVTEAILTYASSNRGWVQEEGSGAQELWSAPVPYESVESPAPHLPSVHCGGAIATTTSDLTDVSDVETEPRLNDAKQTAPDTLQGNPHEQMFQDESPVNLVVEVHQEVSLPSFVETELEPVNIVSDETERLDKKDKDLQGYGCKYTATQTDRPLEEEPQQVATDSKAEDLDKVLQDQETSVAKDVVEISSVDEFTEKSTLDDIDEEKGSQEAALEQNRTMRQTLDEDGHEEDPNITVHYNEGTQDLDKAKQSNHRGQVPFETRAKTQEDVTLQDCHVAKVLQEDTPNNEDQEQDIVHITEDVAILENGLSDEDSSIEASVHEEVKNETICNQSEIATHISCTDCNKDVVVEVNKLNAKCAQTSSEILILEGIQEVLSTQTVQVVENDSTEIPYEHSLNADTANVNTLVLQALEIDSVQYQEKDSPIIFTTHQTDAN